MIERLRYFLAVLVIATTYQFADADPVLCGGCHQKEVEQWSRSQHAVAMAKATADSVLGDFSGAVYSDADLKATFSRSGDQFIIRVDEGDTVRTWQVQYTFGVSPLQQYLIDTGDGRLQAFNVAWDARPSSSGGQRWFRLDQGSKIGPGDPMHWTGIYQNWNNQCADCHTTELTRHYDPQDDSYLTEWSQLGVGCVACHESAEEHAEAALGGHAKGAGVALSAVGAWLTSQGKQPPQHQGAASSSLQVSTCGRCHSLRTSLADPAHGQVHDTFSISRLDQPLYFADGRVNQEVFIEGSFEQSKMFQAGVVCTNCHDPHSGQLKAVGNAVCTRCHNANEFDTPKHHHHPLTSSGAECMSCHMPERTFMGIDDRREHNFTVPRPDVAKAVGRPDVCQSCHTKKDREWSIQTVKTWYPELYQEDTWYHAQQGTLSEIATYLSDETKPAIRRSSLLEQHGPAMLNQHLALIKRLLGSGDAVIRESAFRVLRFGNAESVKALAEPGLDDSSMAVRFAAFESMIYLGIDLEKSVWKKVQSNYEKYLDTQSDLPSGRVLKARYLVARNRLSDAEGQLQTALEKDPSYTPAAMLLTNILRASGRNQEAIDRIDRVLVANPDEVQLIHLRGLINLKLKRYAAALDDLGQATKLAPDQWLFGYRYAVALYQLEQIDKARDMVRKLEQRFPNNARIQALMGNL